MQLLPAFAAAYTACYPLDKTWHGKVRQRQGGGGAKGRLAQMEAKLLFILVYQKTNPLQTMHGLHFGLSQPQTHYWLHRLLPVLRQALVALDLAPERDASRVAPSALRLEGAPAGALDGTERRRQRPPDAAQQTAHDSGKKKAHTDKNVLLINEYTRQVVYLSPTVAGKTHDKQAVDEAGPSCIRSTAPSTRTRVFRAMRRPASCPNSPKKAQRPGVERWRQVPQSSDRQCPHRCGTCDCWGETVPHRQRCLPSDQRWYFGYGHGDCLWFA